MCEGPQFERDVLLLPKKVGSVMLFKSELEDKKQTRHLKTWIFEKELQNIFAMYLTLTVYQLKRTCYENSRDSYFMGPLVQTDRYPFLSLLN